ncbi:MAG: IS21 family transposase [Betaproteobacteria bacterium]
MSTLSKLRRLVLRQDMSVREASRRLGISRNTATKWLKGGQMVEPRYPQRVSGPSILGPYKEQLSQWLKADSHRSKRDRRGIKAMFESLRAQGYSGSRGPVYAFAQRWQQEQGNAVRGAGFVPLSFELGEAFQFDWSCEYLFIGGLRRRLEVAHTKLAASRAFCLVAYYSQAHEMLFDAHARAFACFAGVPRRGIYDNMKTAVDKVGQGKQRSVNARFEAMTGHYLFEPEFCNRAAGWEKGVVEKNVQDRRKDIWREASERRWVSLDELNDWLEQACVKAWGEMSHPEWVHLTVADVWQDERARLMPAPRAFDGYVEQPVRVSATSLIHFQRNRYSVPCEWIHAVVSLRAYADSLLVVGPDGRQVRLARSFERDQTLYDWMHYITLIERKPGALRNGAPFKTMPEPLQELQRQLLRHSGGDRVMAQVLMGVSLHGLEPVLVAVELALQSGRVSAEHVLNVLSRLQEQRVPELPAATMLTLKTPPLANLHRYDALRNIQPYEATPESDHA